MSFSIVPTAEGTCLKVEPEIARLHAASGLAGLQGLAGGQALTAAVGTFQSAPAGAAGAELEPFWGRPSLGTAARPLSAPSHGGSQGHQPAAPWGDAGADAGDQHGAGGDINSRAISWRKAIGIASHLKGTSRNTGFGSATGLLQNSGK